MDEKLLFSLASKNYGVIRVKTRGIWIPQKLDPLWIECIISKTPFKVVAERHHYSIMSLIKSGFNRNYLTRKRWLDIKTLVSMQDYECWSTFKYMMMLEDDQIESWELKDEEWDLLLKGERSYYPNINNNKDVIKCQGMVVPKELMTPYFLTSKHVSIPLNPITWQQERSYQPTSIRS